MTPRTLRGNVWTTAAGHAAVKLLVLILGTYTVVMVCLALTAVKLVLIPVLIAVLLAAAISPLVHFLEGRSIPKTAATLISLVAGLLILGALAAAAGYSIYRQWNELLVNSDAALARLEQMITQSPLPFSAQDLRQARQDAIRSVTADLSVGDAIAAINTLGTFVTGLLLMIVVLFFFLKDGRKIWLFLVRPLHGDRLERSLRAGRNAVETMGAYVRGVTLIAFIDAAGTGVAMLLLGVPMALPLTAIVFLGGFIPVVGATVTGILAVLVAFVTSGIGTALAVAAAVIVVQQLEGNILQPAIMGKAVKLHPLVIILALAIGGIQAGIIGAVLAVPVAAVIWTTVKSWNADTPTRYSETEQKGKPETLRVKARRRRMPLTPGRGTRCAVRRVWSPGVPAGRRKAGADGAVR